MSTFQKVLKNSYKGKKQEKNINGYERDDELSGNRVQVYHNKETGKTITAHRGTQGIHDVMTDAGLLMIPNAYKYGNRYKHSEKVQKQADEKYGKENNVTIGHSLGGKIAHDLKANTNDNVVTYNKAIIPVDLISGINKNETHIKTHTDPVSILAPFDRTKTVSVPSDSFMGSHDIENLQNYHPKKTNDSIHFV